MKRWNETVKVYRGSDGSRGGGRDGDGRTERRMRIDDNTVYSKSRSMRVDDDE